jgi:integrase
MPRPAQGARLYLRKRKGRSSIWVIRDSDGGEVSTSCGAEYRRDAEKQLEAYLAQKHRPNFGNGHPATVYIADVLALYARERAPMTARPDLIGYDVPRLIDFFGELTVDKITPGLCARYVDWRTAQPRSHYRDKDVAPRVKVSTARRELVTLQAAVNYAWKEGKLTHALHVAKPAEAPGRDRWLTRSEVARLLKAARSNRHVVRFVLIALYTGTRHAAILGLRWGVNSEGGWVDLDNGLIYRRGEDAQDTSKRRTPVPISPRLAGHLRRWRSLCRTHVIEWKGEPIGKMRQAWKRARIDAGLGPEVTPHVLRRTFATWAVQAGLPLAKIAGAVGTTEAMIEERYGHHSPHHLRDVVGAVSGAKLNRMAKI